MRTPKLFPHDKIDPAPVTDLAFLSPPPRRGGFSLVLALVIMGMMVVLVACLVSFIGIEMQLTTL
ncbi:MAG: hypothetical protein LBG65_04490, partial [Puniceicoccales bacterium]|nr:hypothetical protein [Puniceicoccales bacterium]